MKTIYVATENSDSTEGRGAQIPIAYFERKEDAIAAAKGHGVMGVGDGEVEEIKVYKSLADWHKGEQEQLRASAISKLTDAEKKVLGLA